MNSATNLCRQESEGLSDLEGAGFDVDSVEKSGDRVIIVGSAELDNFEVDVFQPRVMLVDETNKIIGRF